MTLVLHIHHDGWKDGSSSVTEDNGSKSSKCIKRFNWLIKWGEKDSRSAVVEELGRMTRDGIVADIDGHLKHGQQTHRQCAKKSNESQGPAEKKCTDHVSLNLTKPYQKSFGVPNNISGARTRVATSIHKQVVPVDVISWTNPPMSSISTKAEPYNVMMMQTENDIFGHGLVLLQIKKQLLMETLLRNDETFGLIVRPAFCARSG